MTDDAEGMEDASLDSRPRLPLPTLVASTLASLALVLVVGLQAPAVSVGLRWTPPERARGPVLPKLSLGDPILNLNVYIEQDESGLAKIIVVLAILITLAILVALAFWLLRITRRPPAINVTALGADSGMPSEADAKIVKSGLAAALHIINSEQHAGNAVVRAWQGLEDAAATAGLQRRAAETASEFTARILYRSARSAESIAVLLSLYQRVRFGHHAPTAAEIAAARDSLATLVELWQADFPERKPTRLIR